MMNKTLGFTFLLAAVSLPLQAQPPVQQAPATSAMVGKQIIPCPKHLEGWPFEVIDLYDCGIPGVNVKNICKKWNNNQLNMPANWEYDGIKRYGSVNLIVSSHYMAKIANKNYLYCSYSMNRGVPNLATYIIRQKAPTSSTCTKAGNYSFSCKSRAMQHMQQLNR